MTARCRAGAAAAALCCAIAAPARPTWLTAGPSDRVALDVPRDTAITSLAFLGAVAPLLLVDTLAPANCRWCDGPAGTPVNSIDDWFHQRLTGKIFSRNTANTLSSGLAYGAMPAVSLAGAFFAAGPYATDGAGLRNAAIIAQSVAVSAALVQGLKFSAGRQRPYAHYLHVLTPGGSNDFPALTSDANLSFPSGHTSLAAAAGSSAAMLATLEESEAAPWLWAGTGVITAATGTLRMVSESHYFSDVVVGTIVGGGCGVLFPMLHRRGSLLGGNVVPGVVASGQGANLSLSGAF